MSLVRFVCPTKLMKIEAKKILRGIGNEYAPQLINYYEGQPYSKEDLTQKIEPVQEALLSERSQMIVARRLSVSPDGRYSLNVTPRMIHLLEHRKFVMDMGREGFASRCDFHVPWFVQGLKSFAEKKQFFSIA